MIPVPFTAQRIFELLPKWNIDHNIPTHFLDTKWKTRILINVGRILLVLGVTIGVGAEVEVEVEVVTEKIHHQEEEIVLGVEVRVHIYLAIKHTI